MRDTLKQYGLLLNCLLFLSIIMSVAAQEEGNQTNTTEIMGEIKGNETTAETGQEIVSLDEINRTSATESTETTNTTNTTNQTTATEETMPGILDFIITLTPTEVKQGDAILTVQIENNGTVALQNIIPLVSGRGFSAYDIVSIEEIAPGKTASAYVLGHFSDAGTIVLTIKINGRTVTQPIMVSGSSQNEEERKALEKEALQTLSLQLDNLENKYAMLEEELEQKKKDYLLPEMDIEGVKENIRNAQSRILADEVEEANISIILALAEYEEQKNKLDSAQKKSFFDKIQDNILLISTLAGAILTLFAFFEFVKRKQAGLYQKIKEFKVDKDTKIEVHKKKDPKADKKEGKDNKNKEKSAQESDEDDVPKLDVWEREL